MTKTTFNQANISANADTANLLSGNLNELVQGRARVTFWLKSSASGAKVTIYAGGDVAVPKQEIVAIGTSLAATDDYFVQFDVDGITRLSLIVTETAGVATTDIIGALEVQPY